MVVVTFSLWAGEGKKLGTRFSAIDIMFQA
jgi:hypothetical protein